MKNIKLYFTKHINISYLLISILIAFLTVTFISTVSSFIYPLFCGQAYVNDPNTFFYIGKCIASGMTPYVEIFDHKGLYMFYYEALGYLLGGRVGFYFVQLINFTIFYFIFYKAISLISSNKIFNIFSLLTFMAIYIIFGQSPGDFEVQLVITILFLYFYLKAIIKGDDKSFYFGNLCSGIAAGIAINVRASDAIIPFSAIIFFAIYTIKNRRWKFILTNALICLFGLGLFCLPPLIHSEVQGFTKLMYQTIILDNFKYVGSATERADFSPWISRSIILAVIALSFLAIYHIRNKISKKEILFYVTSFLVVGVVEFVIAYYPHYLLACVPFFLLFIFRYLSLLSFKKIYKYVATFFIGIVSIGAMIYFPVSYFSSQYNKDLAIKEYINYVIPKEAKDGHVLCVNLSSSIYLNSDIKTSYYDFTCQSNHVLISDHCSEDNFKIAVIFSKYVITPHFIDGDKIDNLCQFVRDNKTLIEIKDMNFIGATYIDIYC